MSIPRQILLLLSICLVAILIADILPVPIPSSVIAMLLVLSLLLLRAIKPTHLSDITSAMQKYMAFFFLPTCISILSEVDIIKESGLEILLLCFIGTVATFAVTAFVTTGLIRLLNKKGSE